MSDRINLSTLVLVVANLVPVAGVFLWDWDVFVLLMLFWCENVIIGFFGILKTALTGGIGMAGFFTVHYGGFMFGHAMILIALFLDAEKQDSYTGGDFALLRGVVGNEVTWLPVLALFVSHAWSFLSNFIGNNERERLTGAGAMTMPYKRMVITHVALLFGGFLLSSTGQPIMGLLLLLAMKVALDVSFHRREHRALLGHASNDSPAKGLKDE